MVWSAKDWITVTWYTCNVVDGKQEGLDDGDFSGAHARYPAWSRDTDVSHEEPPARRKPRQWVTLDGLVAVPTPLLRESRCRQDEGQEDESVARTFLVDGASQRFANWWLGQVIAYAGQEDEAVAAFERDRRAIPAGSLK